jgi:hypothetical protein
LSILVLSHITEASNLISEFGTLYQIRINYPIAWRLEVAAIQTKSAFADSKQRGVANQDLVLEHLSNAKEKYMHLSLDVDAIATNPLLQASTKLRYRGIEYTHKRAMHPTEMCNPFATEIISKEPVGIYRGGIVTKQNQIVMRVVVKSIINLKYRGSIYQIVADSYAP